ncbi:hypothetical protein [Methylomonas lenta]|nr:hypothetical protein [Methylomonas lenta]
MGKSKIRWIGLQGPSVALNADNVQYKIKVKYSPVIKAGAPSDQMIKNEVPQGVNHLIFNCHGFEDKSTYPAHLAIGTTITKDNVQLMEPIYSNSTLRVIWFSACNIGGSAGAQELCERMARITGCYIVTQMLSVPDVNLPIDCLVDNAGLMPSYYNPKGKKISRKEFFTYGIDNTLFWPV